MAAHLVGLNSIDFLVDGSNFHLLEINPRPGATLDIFHDCDGRLLHAHVEACRGHLPDKALRFEAAEAAAFVYAPCAIASMPACDWPAWAADRQKPGSALAEHDPLCTIMASGPDLKSARRLLGERAAQILTLIEIHSEKETAA
jgi:predicted ATP-grasp superfamily ATP-dependent carboligase